MTALIALALVAAGGMLLRDREVTRGDTVSTVGTMRDLAGHRVRLEAGVLPAGHVLAQMRVQDDVGVRFEVPSVGLDVPLGSLSMVDDTITPPGITSAYLVRNLGVPIDRAAQGTVYVVMHSIHGPAVGPGDYLTDLADGGSAVKRGAIIRVGDARYVMTTASSLPQTQLPSSAAIWADSPGRVVVITCLQNRDGTPASRNLVIEGRLVTNGSHHT